MRAFGICRRRFGANEDDPPGGDASVITAISFDYFECPECGFSSVQASNFSGSEACPLCAGDIGHDVRMRRRPAKPTDKPEGKDAREIEKSPKNNMITDAGAPEIAPLNRKERRRNKKGKR